MKIIKDIRLYEGAEKRGVSNKIMNLSAHRVAMKLRESAFSLGDFDHLYLCFLANEPAGSVVLDEKIDRYFPWYRYVSIGISEDELTLLKTAEEPSVLFKYMENALLALFGADPSNENAIKTAIEEAKIGPEMLMRFKEKKAAKGTATIWLRLLDNAYYLPVLSVTNAEGAEVLRKNLPRTWDLGNMGEIQLSSKKVTVKPRKNAFTKKLAPISFEINL